MGFLQKLFGKQKQYNSIDPEIVEKYNQTRAEVARNLICHAPTESLLFNINGDAQTCCHNIRHTLGTYPHNSIREMWFGKKAEELREHIANNDLSKGCDSCAIDLNDGNFQWIGARNFDWFGKKTHKYPRTIEFTIDNTCNLECVMCDGELSSSIRQNREKRPAYITPYDEAFIKQLEEFIPYAVSLKFFGGEPFMVDLNFLIWEKVKELNPDCQIKVTTNGTMLNSRIKKLLDSAKFSFNISLDSLNKENYEAIRKNSNLDKVLRNFEYLYDYSKRNNRHMAIISCFMRQNWRDIPQLVQFCIDRNIQWKTSIVKYPIHSALLNLPVNQLEEVYEYYDQFDFECNTQLQKNSRQEFLDAKNAVLNWIDRAKDRPTKKIAKVHHVNSEIGANTSSNAEERRQLMFNKFYNKLEEYIDNESNLSAEDKETKVNRVKNAYRLAFEEIKDEEILIKAFNNIENIPTLWLVSEGEKSTTERLKERIRYAAETYFK